MRKSTIRKYVLNNFAGITNSAFVLKSFIQRSVRGHHCTGGESVVDFIECWSFLCLRIKVLG